MTWRTFASSTCDSSRKQRASDNHDSASQLLDAIALTCPNDSFAGRQPESEQSELMTVAVATNTTPSSEMGLPPPSRNSECC